MGGYGDFIMIMLAKIVSRRSVEGWWKVVEIRAKKRLKILKYFSFLKKIFFIF